MRFVVLAVMSVSTTAAAATILLTPADEMAAFKAAGFARKAGIWQSCGDPGTASYTPGAIAAARDLDGDGRPEAIVTEGSIACFGGTETGYTIVSKQANGGWKRVTGGAGIANVLASKGVGGWPDIEIGGPGFCFPVERWNGREYALLRHQYDGKPCRPRR